MRLNTLFRYFQSRCEQRIKFTEPAPGTKGFVQRNDSTPDEATAGLPLLLTAEARTVRLHESDHLRYSKRMPRWEIEFRKKAKAIGMSQDCMFLILSGMEDARISQLPVWDTRPLTVRRDAVATALRELRLMVRHYDKAMVGLATSPPAVRDCAKANAVNLALRTYALLLMFRRHSNVKVTQKAAKEIRHIIDGPLLGIRLACADIKHGNMASATNHLLNICKPTVPLSATMPDLPPMSEENPDFDDNLYEHSSNLHPDESDSEFVIIRPPLTAPCLPPGEDNPTEDHCSSGYRIRRSCLASIAAGYPVDRPFTRHHVPHPSGVVLFDASGSMHVDNSKLKEVCRLAPAATVMYYSAAKAKTYLVIYAQGGKRMDDSLPMPNHYSGNGKDLLALNYALAERCRLHSEEPIVFVTDCGFEQALATPAFTAAIQDRTARHIGSIDLALQEFSGQPAYS